MNKLYFDWSTYDFLFRETDETWVQGDNDSKSVAIYFGSYDEGTETFTNALTSSTVYDYTVTVVVTRPDGEESPSMTTSAQPGAYYKLLIDDWISEVAGSVEFEPQVKTSTTIANFTAGSIVVQEGTTGSGTTIEESELAALQESIAEKLPAKARGYYFTSELGLTDEGTYTTEQLLSACYDALTASGGSFEFDGIARIAMNNSLDISDLPSGLADVVITIVTQDTVGEASHVSYITGTKYTSTGIGEGYTDYYLYTSSFAGWTQYARKEYVDDAITSAIAALQEDITDGTITAYKATRDANNNVIHSTYTPLSRTIVGLALSSDITLSAFKTALGNATTSLDGLMSSTDKTRLDALYALLGESADADSVVDTINEVLAIFSEYPEGVDMVTALAAKAALAGGNDFTGTQTITQSGAVYSNNGSVETMTDNSSTYRIYRTANALSVQEYTGGAWVTKYYVSKDGAFYASGLTPTDPSGYSHLISKEEADSLIEAESTARESADNEIRQDLASAQIELNALSEAFAKSSNGDDTATVTGTDIASLGKDVARAPLKVTVDGGVLKTTQLVTNPDFTTDFTGWAATLAGTPSVAGGIVSFTATATEGRISQTNTTVSGRKYYATAKYKADSNMVYLLATNPTTFTAHSGGNSYERISLILTSNSTTTNLRITDTRTSGWTAVYVDNVYLYDVTTLINAKQYSPISNTTFDLLSDAQIKAQMDAWVLAGFIPNDNLLYVGGNKRFTSEGKNLVDSKSLTYTDGYIISSTGTITANTGSYVANDYIRVWPSTQYTLSCSASTTWRVAYYDKNKNFISRDASISATSITFTTAAWVFYIRISGEIAQKNLSVQLEYGSVATTYEPYAKTELALFGDSPLYRVPNGTKDTLEPRYGKYYRVKRTAHRALISTDITNLDTSYTNLDVYRIDKPSDFIYDGLSQTTSSGRSPYAQWINNYAPYDGTTYDDLTNIGKILTNYYPNQWGIGIAKGTYANLAAAQAALAGTEIIYQLATPIETEISSKGVLDGYPSGRVLIDDIITNVAYYTDSAAVEDTAYPILSLDFIEKYENDAFTTLAVSGATIAGDGLSFTHSSLSAGDIVRFGYTYFTDDVKMLTTVTYYDNKNVVVDSVTSTVYKLVPTVASGVLTWTLTAI